MSDKKTKAFYSTFSDPPKLVTKTIILDCVLDYESGKDITGIVGGTAVGVTMAYNVVVAELPDSFATSVECMATVIGSEDGTAGFTATALYSNSQNNFIEVRVSNSTPWTGALLIQATIVLTY